MGLAFDPTAILSGGSVQSSQQELEQQPPDPVDDLQARAQRARQLPGDPEQSALMRSRLGLPEPEPQQPIQQQQPYVDPQLDALKQKLYENVQQLNTPTAGGVKGILQRFLIGGGNAMMKQVGIPTDEELRQRGLQNL